MPLSTEQLETLLRRSRTTHGTRWCICVDPENCRDRGMPHEIRACRAIALDLPLPPPSREGSGQ